MTSALPPPALPSPVSPGRRRVLRAAALLAGAAALARPALAAPAFADGAALLVAGPPGGATDQWADLIGPALARALPPGNRLQHEAVGGADGVTGANQFETRTAPDGSTALLVPGAAAIAWLVGDPRARFDAARWVSALAGVTSGVLVSHLPLARLGPGRHVRLATTGPAGLDLPVLLALDLMGAAVQSLPVAATSPEMLSQPGVDAVFLHGRGADEAARTLAALGTPTLLTLGLPDEGGRGFGRDPGLHDVLSLPEMLPRAAGRPLYAAWRAAAVAAQLDTALVLPTVTPAAMVALWRRACAQAAAGPEVQAGAAGMGVRVLTAPACASLTAALAVDAGSLLELRRWLAGRHDWRPS